jgi:putative flippase GtrA
MQFYRKNEEKIRFLVVGGWNTVFGYCVFTVLYLFFPVHYMLDMIISNIISITNSYICYKFFVFKTKGNYLLEYLRFYLVYGTAFLLNIVLLPLFVKYFKIHVLVSQAMVLIFVVIISYFGHKYFSFRISPIAANTNEINK